ncbi:MAG: SH3 domain-containing protein, partial [Candidatus Puniceispirillaceae bacterium]
SCPKNWCRVATDNVKGWVERSAVWGVLDGESLK